MKLRKYSGELRNDFVVCICLNPGFAFGQGPYAKSDCSFCLKASKLEKVRCLHGSGANRFQEPRL